LLPISYKLKIGTARVLTIRHNGNILINSDGHLVHIDFGFVLTTAPGGINFESAPFKITADYMKLMGGPHSAMFAYFKILLIQGFLAIRKYIDEISDILEIMSMESKLPCFEKFDIRTFRDRFKISLTDEEVLYVLMIANKTC